MSDLDLFESWAIVELMGHIRMAGRVTEEERFGAKMGRIDIPLSDGGFATQYFGGASVYRVSPCSEEVARAVASRNEPRPIHRWELPSEDVKQITQCDEDEHEYSDDMSQPF